MRELGRSAAAALPVASWFTGVVFAIAWSGWLWIPVLLCLFVFVLFKGVQRDQERLTVVSARTRVAAVLAMHEFHERQIRALYSVPSPSLAGIPVQRADWPVTDQIIHDLFSESSRPYPVALPVAEATRAASQARAAANTVREEAYVTGYLIGAYGERPQAILRKPPRKRSTYLELYRAAKARWMETGNLSDKLKMESHVRLAHPAPGDADYE